MIFLKLGGSIITHKDRPFSVNWEVLGRLAGEVSELEERMVIGHGGGSFGHYVAEEYGGRDEGFPKICAAMDKLNQMVVASLISKEVPAIGFHPRNFMLARGGELEMIEARPLVEISRKFVPVVHGDAILDLEEGYTIFSTERVFREIGRHLKPKKVLLASSSPVIIDGEPLREVGDWNLRDVLEQVGGAGDATGGMKGKVEEAARLSAESGTAVCIFDGTKKGALKRALKYGEGTVVRVSGAHSS